jgi:predicted DNA-binding transcriptional regulator AlpA
MTIALLRYATRNKEQTMKLLSWDDLRERGIHYSKSQIWRKAREGSFPKPVYPGRSPAWTEPEIDEYLEQLIAKRDSKSVIA